MEELNSIQRQAIQRRLSYKIFYLAVYGPGDACRFVGACIVYGPAYLYGIYILTPLARWQAKRNLRKLLKSM